MVYLGWSIVECRLMIVGCCFEWKQKANCHWLCWPRSIKALSCLLSFLFSVDTERLPPAIDLSPSVTIRLFHSTFESPTFMNRSSRLTWNSTTFGKGTDAWLHLEIGAELDLRFLRQKQKFYRRSYLLELEGNWFRQETTKPRHDRKTLSM